MWTKFKAMMSDWRGVLEKAVFHLLYRPATGGVSPIAAPFQRWSVRRLGGGEAPEDLWLTQERVFTMDQSYDQAFTACIDSLKSLPRARVGRCDRTKGLVSGRARVVWWSYIGNDIMYELTAIDQDRTRVELTSNPRSRSIEFDYGSNYDIAERLTATLGVKPEQYLLRAAHGADSDDDLLRPATGAPTESTNLLRPNPADEPEKSDD